MEGELRLRWELYPDTFMHVIVRLRLVILPSKQRSLLVKSRRPWHKRRLSSLHF
jgi:hypothetical protein